MGFTPLSLREESVSKTSFYLLKHKCEFHAVFWHIVCVQEAVELEVELPGQVAPLCGGSQPAERSQGTLRRQNEVGLWCPTGSRLCVACSLEGLSVRAQITQWVEMGMEGVRKWSKDEVYQSPSGTPLNQR